MDSVESIRYNFTRGYFGKAMRIFGLPDAYPAWTVKQDNWVAVVVPLDRWYPFSEQFAQVRISTLPDVEIDGRRMPVLMLRCDDLEYRDIFAILCSDFVDQGQDGSSRRRLIANPEGWWTGWKSLVGNISGGNTVYDVLGELLAVKYFLKNGEKPVWGGAEGATHDIECDLFSAEVKSTVQRYGYEVQISSVYQMNQTGDKPLWLFFTRLEQSALGICIEEIADEIVALGYDRAQLEKALERKKLEKGRPARRKKYKIIEWKKYPVNDIFPRINESSFKGDSLPAHVLRFNYTIDLSGVPGDNLL